MRSNQREEKPDVFKHQTFIKIYFFFVDQKQLKLNSSIDHIVSIDGLKPGPMWGP